MWARPPTPPAAARGGSGTTGVGADRAVRLNGARIATPGKPDGDATPSATVLERVPGPVLVEAMACGLRVIATDCAGPRSIVEHGETGWLVPPDDQQALTEAITHALRNTDDRRRRGTAALRHAHERYTWPAIANHLASIYQDTRQDSRRVGPERAPSAAR